MYRYLSINCTSITWTCSINTGVDELADRNQLWSCEQPESLSGYNYKASRFEHQIAHSVYRIVHCTSTPTKLFFILITVKMHNTLCQHTSRWCYYRCTIYSFERPSTFPRNVCFHRIPLGHELCRDAWQTRKLVICTRDRFPESHLNATLWISYAMQHRSAAGLLCEYETAALLWWAVLLFQRKYRIGHPENCLFSLSIKIFSGSKCPKNIFIWF